MSRSKPVAKSGHARLAALEERSFRDAREADALRDELYNEHARTWMMPKPGSLWRKREDFLGEHRHMTGEYEYVLTAYSEIRGLRSGQILAVLKRVGGDQYTALDFQALCVEWECIRGRPKRVPAKHRREMEACDHGSLI